MFILSPKKKINEELNKLCHLGWNLWKVFQSLWGRQPLKGLQRLLIWNTSTTRDPEVLRICQMSSVLVAPSLHSGGWNTASSFSFCQGLRSCLPAVLFKLEELSAGSLLLYCCVNGHKKARAQTQLWDCLIKMEYPVKRREWDTQGFSMSGLAW